MIPSRTTGSMREHPPPLDMTSVKRPYPGEGISSAPPTIPRFATIQPKPSPYPMTNLTSPLTTEPARKKRGRPTKAEAEMRREAEAAARFRSEPNPTLRRDMFGPPLLPMSTGPRPESSLTTASGPSLAATQAAQAAMTPQFPGMFRTEADRESSVDRSRRRQGDESLSRASMMELDEQARKRKESSGSTVQQQGSSSRYPNILSEDEPGSSNFRGPR